MSKGNVIVLANKEKVDGFIPFVDAMIGAVLFVYTPNVQRDTEARADGERNYVFGVKRQQRMKLVHEDLQLFLIPILLVHVSIFWNIQQAQFFEIGD